MVVQWLIKFPKQRFVHQIRIILGICFQFISTNSLTSPIFNLLILATNVSLGNRAISAIQCEGILCCDFLHWIFLHGMLTNMISDTLTHTNVLAIPWISICSVVGGINKFVHCSIKHLKHEKTSSSRSWTNNICYKFDHDSSCWVGFRNFYAASQIS